MQRKNTLLIFSKLPEPGLVKTRLTTLKDGVFEPEVASALYHCMLFDVVEICCAALAKLETQSAEDTYELVISTTPPENVPKMQRLFEQAGTWPRELIFIADIGASFDEHYNNAFEQCWQRGADCILSMGADMPALTVNDVLAGFNALHEIAEMPNEDCPPGAENTRENMGQGIVLAPDQEMGVSVIGWTHTTLDALGAPFDHSGVFYNSEGLTVLPAYVQKAREATLPAIYLPPIPDVDSMRDLMHNITLVEALNYCAPYDGNTPPWRTAQALKEIGWDEVRVPPNDLRDTRDHIDK